MENWGEEWGEELVKQIVRPWATFGAVLNKEGRTMQMAQRNALLKL